MITVVQSGPRVVSDLGVRLRVFEAEMLSKHFDGATVMFFEEFDSEAMKANADYYYWRPNSEKTTASELEGWKKKAHRYWNKKHINNPKNWHNMHCKDEAFKVWKSIGVPCPDYCIFNSRGDFHSWWDGEYPILLRLNNHSGGECTYFVDSSASLDTGLSKLDYDFKHKNIGLGSKKMAVKFIDNDIDGHKWSFRIIVAGNMVVTGYARLSDDWCAITKFFKKGMEDTFVRANEACEDFCNDWTELIVKAVHSLGLNFQGVDVILDKQGNPYFIEVQSAFSVGYANDRGWNPPFYNPSQPEELVKFLKLNKESLEKIIPMYYNNWLDKERLFDLSFESLRRYLDEEKITNS